MATTRMVTLDEFAAMDPAEGRFELIRGELREVAAAGMRHGEIGSEFHRRIANYVAERRLGRTYTSDTGFVLEREGRQEVVMPDVAFVRTERLPPEDEREGLMPGPPDLVVEVVSPSDRQGHVEDKIDLYMAAGVPLLWLTHPSPKTVTVYRPGREPRVLSLDDELDGDDILPGFRLRVADVFA